LFVGVFRPLWSGRVDFSRHTTRNLTAALANDRLIGAIHNSVEFSLWAVLITLPLGYVIASLLVRGRRYRILRTLLDFIVALPLGVPAVMFGFGFLFAYSNGPF